MVHRVWSGGALALLHACAEAPSTDASTSSASGAALGVVSATPAAPSAVELPQSPECKEALVTTVCGRTVRCRTNDKDRKLYRDGEPVAVDNDECLRALRDVREILLAIEKQPLANGEWPTPSPAETCLPEMAERERAYRGILAYVRKEGVARARKMADASAAQYWATLIGERFDLSSVTAGCRSESGFLVSVGAGVGAPGSLPYGGLFRIVSGKAPEMLAERSDQAPMTSGAVGDLDGDGVEEEVVRFSLRDAAGDHRGARYALADANRAGLLEIESRPDESPDDRPAEPVAAVRLPSGLALAVGKRLLLYKGGALLDAPESAHVERRAFEKRASDRARSVLTKLDAELPPGEPCSDVRLGFTIKLAAELREAGVVRGWFGIGPAAELARTKACPVWSTLYPER